MCESNKAKERINSGRVFWSTRTTKMVLPYARKIIVWGAANLPPNLAEIASSSKKKLQKAKVPPGVRRMLRNFKYEKGEYNYFEEEFIPEENPEEEKQEKPGAKQMKLTTFFRPA